jgi:CheY-like chemotaxis protein
VQQNAGLVRNTTVKTLESAGYLAVDAGDGNKALRAYASERADLVITDIIMPDKDGIEMIRTLLKHNRDLGRGKNRRR